MTFDITKGLVGPEGDPLQLGNVPGALFRIDRTGSTRVFDKESSAHPCRCQDAEGTTPFSIDANW
jgi:hypothetical protein